MYWEYFLWCISTRLSAAAHLFPCVCLAGQIGQVNNYEKYFTSRRVFFLNLSADERTYLFAHFFPQKQRANVSEQVKRCLTCPQPLYCSQAVYRENQTVYWEHMVTTLLRKSINFTGNEGIIHESLDICKWHTFSHYQSLSLSLSKAQSQRHTSHKKTHAKLTTCGHSSLCIRW